MAKKRGRVAARQSRVRLVHTELVSMVRESSEPVIKPEQAGRQLLELIGDRDRECFVALHLDVRHCVLSVEIVSVGSLTASLIHPREVFKAAILQNAWGVICGHNHPSGNLEPSADDLAVRARLLSAGELLGIQLVDFLIVGDGRWRSLNR